MDNFLWREGKKHTTEMSRTLKIINIAAFSIWIALLSLVVYRQYAGTTLEKTEALKGSIDKATYWYDIYAGSKKIGFASTTYEKVGEEIIIRHEREYKVKSGNDEKTLLQYMKCLSDAEYSMKSFEFSSHFKGENGIKITGEVDSEDIIFFIESMDKRKTYRLSKQGRDIYLPITLIPVVHLKKPALHATFLVPTLNLTALSVDEIKVELEEVRLLKVLTNILSLYKFKVGESIVWINDRGIIIKQEYPSGITFYSQVEKFADDPADRILFDYTSLPYFRSNKVITDPEKLRRLRVSLRGFKFDPQLYLNSAVKLEHDVLTIEKEDIEHIKERTYRLPYMKADLQKYLSPDEWVRSTYKSLMETGRIYARSYNYDAFLFSQYVTAYTYGLIRTTPMFVLSNSEEFLKTLSGDYLERTIMFATYSRAGGLPTRLVGGLVYLNGYFYFHTWPEIWFDKWIPVDPTFAQFPADVTHIPLREGSVKDITSLVNELKSLDIEVLEAS